MQLNCGSWLYALLIPRINEVCVIGSVVLQVLSYIFPSMGSYVQQGGLEWWCTVNGASGAEQIVHNLQWATARARRGGKVPDNQSNQASLNCKENTPRNMVGKKERSVLIVSVSDWRKKYTWLLCLGKTTVWMEILFWLETWTVLVRNLLKSRVRPCKGKHCKGSLRWWDSVNDWRKV